MLLHICMDVRTYFMVTYARLWRIYVPYKRTNVPISRYIVYDSCQTKAKRDFVCCF